MVCLSSTGLCFLLYFPKQNSSNWELNCRRLTVLSIWNCCSINLIMCGMVPSKTSYITSGGNVSKTTCGNSSKGQGPVTPYKVFPSGWSNWYLWRAAVHNTQESSSMWIVMSSWWHKQYLQILPLLKPVENLPSEWAERLSDAIDISALIICSWLSKLTVTPSTWSFNRSYVSDLSIDSYPYFWTYFLQKWQHGYSVVVIYTYKKKLAGQTVQNLKFIFV